MYYTIRIDLSDQKQHLIQDFLFDNRDILKKYLIFKEVSEKVKKEHYQGLIDIDSIDYEKIKKRFHRYFNKQGLKESQRSMAKVRNEESYPSYISKDNDLRFNQGFTKEEIEEFHKKSFKKDKKKNTNREKSHKDGILELYKGIHGKKIIKRELIKTILSYSYQNKLMINTYLIIGYSNYVINQIMVERDLESYTDSVIDNLGEKILYFDIFENK